MAEINCGTCGKRFYVKPSHVSRRRSCSQLCRDKSYVGKKHSEGTKKKISVGLLKGRTRTSRAAKNINGKSKLMSHFVWCSQKGNLPYVPKGMVIHHLDNNCHNNNPDNLLLLPRPTHASLHMKIRNKNIGGYIGR